MTQEVPAGKSLLSKEQILEHFRRRYEQTDTRSEVVRELYDKADKSLVTENPAAMILPKVGLRVLLASMDPKNTASLLQVWMDAYNDEMISFDRRGRLELLGALQALSDEETSKGMTHL